jgi:hypothetical protein
VSPRQEAILVGVVVLLLAALGLLLSRQYHLTHFGTRTTRCEAAFLGAGRPAIEPTFMVVGGVGTLARRRETGPATLPVRALSGRSDSSVRTPKEVMCHATVPTKVGPRSSTRGCLPIDEDSSPATAPVKGIANTMAIDDVVSAANGSRWWGRRQWEQSGAGTVRQSVRGHRAGGQGLISLCDAVRVRTSQPSTALGMWWRGRSASGRCNPMNQTERGARIERTV